ncbi:AlkA N-terminal domain-containing protein [Promicromonospora citrea]|uniref:DNA-3-methyladenine glycosylase II n=1 Tax=Promicromonospora citrea TaxID=43677 RepID=A0A8H9GCY3_9MICO|nr:AlkA N-terminal domain-containing protein [Promicromonospora citrea]NNH53132.1 DNA-3-methyladenine glycosylase 2 family protein [Promicromonospora citrea]GGM10138.1 DNA-3-methyladenine glycosylase [Promicromonospora citrea]
MTDVDTRDPAFTERYRAIAARDARFDGQFFTAVRTTGIYCRPSCPARTPKAENVSFYLTSAAAHEAGFRACKRCLPEAAPGTPAWDLRRDLAGRAMRLVADGVVDREGVSGLATRLGYSERQLHRLLVAELGAGPLALARAQRAQTARALLVGTSLRLADVAFAAGFGSIRQFNDTVAEVFGTTPSDLRARAAARRPARRAGAGQAPGDGPREAVRISLTLPVREPFDARGVVEFLAVRAIPGVEAADVGPDLRYARTVLLPHGPGAFDVRVPRTGSGRVELDLELADLADAPVAVARVRRLLDLDADPVAVDDALAADPVLAPSVAAVPGIRVPGAVDPAELLVRAVVGQQISVAAARTHLTRLAHGAGRPYVSAIPGLDRLFPAPHEIAAPAGEAGTAAQAYLRLPARILGTVVAAARDLAEGSLTLSVGDDPDDLRRRLVARPGIGPWTAGYVALRVLGDPDVLMDGDVALLAGARTLGLVPADVPRPHQFKELARRGAAWAPWRSYAAMHLWRSA